MSVSEGQKLLAHLVRRGRWVNFPATAQTVAGKDAEQNPAGAIQAAVQKIFGIRSDDFATFDLTIARDIPPLGATPDSAADPAPQNLDSEDIAREYEKRRMVNALMQGGAVVAALEAIRQADLPKETRQNYADLLAAGTFQQQQLMERGGNDGIDHGALPPAGVVEVSHDDSGLAHVSARAVDGAVLAHEAAKGLLELAAMWGAPGAEDNDETPPMFKDYNAALRREVMRRADRPEYELEDILHGIVLWVDHFGKTIGPETLSKFQELCLLPATEFNAVLTAEAEAPRLATDVANDNPQLLAAMRDENLRVNNAIKATLHTEILPHANLPTDEAARAAIINWMTGAHLRNYITSQPGGAVALTTPDMNNQLKHIIDYLHAALTDSSLPKEYILTAAGLQASDYQTLAAKAENWMAWQSRQAIDGVLEAGRDYDVVMELEGGMRLVELKTPLALDYEGQQMGHCIGGSYDDRLNGNGGYRQYGLWDMKGGYCTFEVNQGTLQQCQGKKNQPPVARYVPAMMAVILAQGWKLGDIPASRTGLVTDREGQIYSVHDLPEVFNGDLQLDGLQAEVRLPRHVKGSVAVQNTECLDLSRLEKVDGDFNANGGPMKEITTAHLRAVQVRGKATWPLGVLSDKRGRIYSVYDLCDEVFDGDVDLSGTNVASLGQNCKKITGSVFNGTALIDTGAVEEIGGDIRGCHALQNTRVRKVGGNLAGLLALTRADELEEVGQSVLILPRLSDAPRLRHVGKNLYLNSTALTQAHPDLQIGCIKDAELSTPTQPKQNLLQQLLAHRPEQASIKSASSLIARRAAKTGRIEIGGDEWSELVDIHQSGDILPDKTILYAKPNNEAWITTPENLPNYVSWNELTKDATEQDIVAQRINIHPQVVKQGVNDHGYQDWSLPTITGQDAKDECYALYQTCDNGALQGTFDKSGSYPASYLWSARYGSERTAYCQWFNDDFQDDFGRANELSVRPVRRVPQRMQGAALVI